MTREIILTQGQVAIVDDCDYEMLTQFQWHVITSKCTCYAARNEGHKRIWMHRLITSCPDGLQVDHIDGNGLNNVRSNLRICTNAQNSRNRKRGRLNKSGYKGVCFSKFFGTWQGHIFVNGKQTDLGMFPTAIEAARAYDAAARKHFGEFARTNFPQ